jgi:hypothetical protein
MDRVVRYYERWVDIIRAIEYNSTYSEMFFLMKALCSYGVFDTMDMQNKAFLTHVIYHLLKEEDPDNVRKTVVADSIADKGNPECGNLMLVYDALLNDSEYRQLNACDKRNYLIDTFNKLNQFRDIKCIENNFRTKHTQVYYNMLPRYIMDFANYIRSHPGCFREIYKNKLNIRETVEEVEYIVVVEPVVDIVIVGECDACGDKIKEWYDIQVCIGCDMVIFP